MVRQFELRPAVHRFDFIRSIFIRTIFTRFVFIRSVFTRSVRKTSSARPIRPARASGNDRRLTGGAAGYAAESPDARIPMGRHGAFAYCR